MIIVGLFDPLSTVLAVLLSLGTAAFRSTSRGRVNSFFFDAATGGAGLKVIGFADGEVLVEGRWRRCTWFVRTGATTSFPVSFTGSFTASFATSVGTIASCFTEIATGSGLVETLETESKSSELFAFSAV